jgi:hypothetical protein
VVEEGEEVVEKVAEKGLVEEEPTTTQITTEQQVTTNCRTGKISITKAVLNRTTGPGIKEVIFIIREIMNSSHEGATCPGEAIHTLPTTTDLLQLSAATTIKDTVIINLSTCQTPTTTNNFLRALTTTNSLICNNGGCWSEDGG